MGTTPVRGEGGDSISLYTPKGHLVFTDSATAADPCARQLARRRTLRSVGLRAAAAGGIALVTALALTPGASAATPASTTSNSAAPVASTSSAASTTAAAAAHGSSGTLGVDFELDNLTPFRLTLRSATSPAGWEDGDGPNEKQLWTGFASTWWVNDSLSNGSEFEVDYDFTDDKGAVDTVSAAESTSGVDSCWISGDGKQNWQCDIGATSSGERTFTLHASNADMTLSATDKDQFAQALNNLCTTENNGNGSGAGGQATCTFTPSSTAPTFAEGSQGFVPTGAENEPGCYADEARDTYQYTGSGSTSQTASVGTLDTVSVESGALDIADFGFSHTYTWGKSFTNSVGYSDEDPVTADYGYIATPFWYPTIGTASGAFTATLEGTTYTFDDVTIRTAGASGSNVDGQHFGQYTPTTVQRKMTEQEWDRNCAGLPFPTVS